MKLTGKQVKQIHSALLDGYSPDSLRRLVRIHLDENLYNISSGNNFSDQVFTLIEWAEQQGRIEELVRAAYEETPNNPALQTLWQDWQSWLVLPAARTLRLSQGAGGSASEPVELAEPSSPPQPAPQLFLSYSRSDTLAMRQLRVAIEAAGISVWTDEGLEPGTPSWQAAIESAIRVAKAMVVLLSPAAKSSTWVNIEVSFALRLGRRVFPVLVAGDDTDAVPITLFTTQFVDGRSDLDRVVKDKLLPALRSYLGLDRPLTGEHPPQQSRNLPDSGIVPGELSPTANPIAGLVATMQDDSLPPKIRLEAGLKAADLGDLPPDLDALVFMPSKVQLGYDFRIGKYPITNHQYRRFIETGGYTNKRWWQDEVRRNYRKQYKLREPRDWGNPKFNHATQPVVGISWFEAVTYCIWLTAQWQADKQIGQNEQVQLPSQAEWIFAARSGHTQLKDKARDFPWQGFFNPSYANTQESRLEQTTPVHMYPAGCTLTGVWDISGNTWEWTRDTTTSSGVYYLKGGSWCYTADQATISAVGRNGASNWGDYYGFRCVVAPTSH